MAGRTAWHVPDDALAAYDAGRAGDVVAASVETHLVRCEDCRATLARLADPADAELGWARLADAVDRPTPTALERLGVRRGTTARVTWASPGMRGAWLACVALVGLLPGLTAGLTGVSTLTALLALAPVAPVVAVAVAYRATTDPAGELALATPRAGLPLVARRALAVSVAAVPLGVLVGLLADLPLGQSLAWVLPGLALAATVLAVGTTRWDPTPVAVALSGAWALAVGLPSPVWDVAARTLATTVAGPAVQLTALTAAAAALLVAVARRDALAYRSAS